VKRVDSLQQIAGHALVEKIFRVLTKLQTSKDEEFLCWNVFAMTEIVQALPLPLFMHKQTGSLLQGVLEKLYDHCNSDNPRLRSLTSGLFYVMIEENFRHKGHVGRMDVQSAVAIAKYVGGEKGRKYDVMTAALEDMLKRATPIAERGVPGTGTGTGKGTGTGTSNNNNNNNTASDHSADPEQKNASSSSSSSSSNNSFADSLREIVKHVIEITRYEDEINRNWVDGETVADLYIKIGHDFQKNPDMRCTWLENLAVVNMQNANVEEAVQCKLHIAGLICEYLNANASSASGASGASGDSASVVVSHSPLPVELRQNRFAQTFAQICPNVLSEPALISSHTGARSETSFQGSQWSVEGLVTAMQEAEKLLERANRYEQCLNVLHLLSRVYLESKNFGALLEWSDRHRIVAQRLVDQQEQGQSFSHYYRLQLFGSDQILNRAGQKDQDQDQDQDASESSSSSQPSSSSPSPHSPSPPPSASSSLSSRLHILKKPAKHTIGNIQSQLKTQLVRVLKLREDQVLTVPNNASAAQLATFDAPDQTDRIYFQIVSVAPHFGEGELAARGAAWERQFDIRTFVSEVPFMASQSSIGPDGKVQSDGDGGGKVDDAAVDRLAKKKTFFTTARSFPYMNNRLPVASTREITLNAIECALEAMRERVHRFREVLREEKLRPNALQALLTGTLMAAVNVGPLRYCEVFLAKEGDADAESVSASVSASYPPGQVGDLRRSMAEMIMVTGVALRLNATVIAKEQIPLQDMLTTRYAALHDEFRDKYASAELLQLSQFDRIDSPHL
jgi:DHR-2, Lobe A/DHR-2, Lobe C/DHR-2, Lobe B